MSKQLRFARALIVLAVLAGCSKETLHQREDAPTDDFSAALAFLDIDPFAPSYQSLSFPGHLVRSGLKPHPVSDTKAQLGRVLFYDKNLSKDRSVSCASCHKQELGFADDEAFSQGVFERRTSRNSMALGAVVNYSAYHSVALNGPTASGFFWDERVDAVTDQTRATLLNTHEMDIQMPEVVARVQALPYYNWLFQCAYGESQATEDRVLEAISEFVNAMGSYRSKFDQFATNLFPAELEKPIVGFTNEENRGWGLFLGFCSGCHGIELGKPPVLRANNGLELNYTDQGLGALTGNPADNGVFKVPGLRNIALSAPYMHDGRFKTLDDVLDFYSNGVKGHPNLHLQMRKTATVSGTQITSGGWGGGTTTIGSTVTGNLAGKLNLTASDKAAIKAFLHTLTDASLVLDPRFSDPFRK